MILNEAGSRLAGWNVEILATDICTEVLDKARAGVYSQFEVQRGLPIQLLLKYFTQEGDQWKLAPQIKSMVDFRQLNLIQGFTQLGTFDIIYCRNVLIYFDQPTKTDVLRRLANALSPDGSILLGAAETVIGLTDALAPHPEHRGLYVPASRGVQAQGSAPAPVSGLASFQLRAAGGR
jgi:chemotaxis protein methyltransferase CheR